jgi:hypothetical protein
MNAAAVDKPRPWRVRVHVYQLVSNRTNRICKSVGVGGLYHTGVEVGGVEYGFGFHEDAYTGVWKQIPRQLPRDFARGRAVHVALIDMGVAVLTARQLQHILGQSMADFPGNGYSVLHRNCNHYTVDLCERLVQRRPPEWINSAARKGARISLAVGRATASVVQLGRIIKAPLRVQMRLARRTASLLKGGPPLKSPARLKETPRRTFLVLGGRKSLAARIRGRSQVPLLPSARGANGGAVASQDEGDSAVRGSVAGEAHALSAAGPSSMLAARPEVHRL